MTSPSRSRQYRRQDAIKRKFGLEWDMYVELHAKQNGACAICEKPLSLIKSTETETAFVDHDHATGKVRGLLCNPCNRGLGYFRDSRLHLKGALKYLDNHHAD